MHVVVIGAGVIGAAVADALVTRGAGVTVLDARGPGRGASQASAGILAPYTEAHQDSPLLALGTRSLAMFESFIAGVRERSGRPVEFARTGTLEVALTPEDCTRLHDALGWVTEAGVPAEWIEPSALRAFERAVTPAALGGLFVPPHGFVAVPALVDALVHAARFGGATFETPADVVRVQATADGVEVGDDRRRWPADAVVVCAGSWSGRVRIEGAPRIPVRPVRGQLLELEWTAADQPGRVVWGPGCYTVPWSDRTVLVGATVEDAGFDESVTVGGVRELGAAVEALLPAAAGARLKATRVGLRPAMPDGLPAIGPLAVSPRVVVATGHYRNGILLAPFTADVVARCVLEQERDPALTLTDPNRASLSVPVSGG